MFTTMCSIIIKASFSKDKINKYLTGDNTGKVPPHVQQFSALGLLEASDTLLLGDSSSPSNSESESTQSAQEASSTDTFPSFGLDP